MSFQHIQDHADTYLTSLVNIDQSPAIDDDKDGSSQKSIMRMSHAWLKVVGGSSSVEFTAKSKLRDLWLV